MNKIVKIPLGRGFVSVVDIADFGILRQFNWWVNFGSVRPRAMGKVNGKQIYMHRFILNAPRSFDVDHINRDSLDNRRCNLRLATRTQNNANAVRKKHTSQFKGVSWQTERNCWTASGSLNNRRLHLGRFAVEEMAALAYDSWADEHYGEFARLNFPK